MLPGRTFCAIDESLSIGAPDPAAWTVVASPQPASSEFTRGAGCAHGLTLLLKGALTSRTIFTIRLERPARVGVSCAVFALGHTFPAAKPARHTGKANGVPGIVLIQASIAHGAGEAASVCGEGALWALCAIVCA